MRAVPVSDVLGVELQDFDLTRPSTPAEQAELRELFCQHHLILVRGQEITDEHQNRFLEAFGPLHVIANGSLQTYISNRPDRTMGVGTSRLLWHSDGTYGARPGIATSLLAVEVSPESAPTSFANAVRALERLPADLRARIEPLHAVHLRDLQVEPDSRWREADIPADAAPGRFVRQVHPLDYPLPHSEKCTLLVNELLTSHVLELPEDEGEALLQELFSRIYADDNTYTHVWQPHDLVLWDNLALQHCRPADMGTATRHLRRQSLDGWRRADGTVLDWRETAILHAGTAAAPTEG